MYSSAFCAGVNISGTALFKVDLGCSIIISNFIELNRLYAAQPTVVLYSRLHQQQVLALLGHRQDYKD